MSEKKTEFNKVLNIWDILVLAFGAMSGWAWVVSTGDWIMQGGVAGAMLGFVLGGVMIFFVGLAYAELTTAMPQNGGEHVFSYRALGKNRLLYLYVGYHFRVYGRCLFRSLRIADNFRLFLSRILTVLFIYCRRV